MDIANSVSKKLMVVVLGFVILLCQSPIFVSAHNHVTKIVKVGYYENEIFQEGAAEGAVKSGYAYEYYRKLSEYTGWRYEYVYGSYNELYQELIDGDIDMLAGIAYREDRKALMAYPEIPMGTEAYVLVKHEADKDITSDPSTLSGHSIGVLNSNMSTRLDEYLSEHHVRANVIRFDKPEDLLASFDNAEVEILAAEGNGTNIRKNSEVLFAFATTDYYICVNKADSILLNDLNEAQNQLSLDEPYYLSTLNAKYYASTLTAHTLSAVEKEWISSHPSITIGYFNNYLPYSDTDENGQVTGIVKDVVPKIFEAVKVDDVAITYKGYDNYNDMIAAVDSEEIDAAFPVSGGLYYSEENGIYLTSSFLSSSTDLIYKNVVIYPDNSTFAVNTNNMMQYYYVKSNYPNAEVVFYDSIEDCLKAVLKGEVDCTTLNGLRASSMLKNVDYEDLSLRQLSSTDARCMGVRIGNEGLLRLLNRGIQITGNDYMENQAYKYTERLYKNPPTNKLRRYLQIILLVVLGVIFLIAVLLFAYVMRLRKAVAQLKSDNSTKASFINNMTSVIREPIREIAESTESATGAQLLSIVDNIIDLSHFDNGKVVLKEDNIHITSLVRNLEDELQEVAASKKINLAFSSKDIRNKDVITDEARLTQVLNNTLTNAIKYSPKGSQVQMVLEEQKSSNPRITNMIFTIKDNGIGMSQEFQKRAFEAYAREDTSIDGAQGAGLGLTIADNIVRLMGGTITINSTKDAGSGFVVRVPVKINYRI